MIKNHFFKKSSTTFPSLLFTYQKLFCLLIILCCFYQGSAQNIGANWTSPSTGTLNGVDFTLTGEDGTQTAFDLSTTHYSGAPLSSNQEITTVGSRTSWSITFDSPVTNPRVYFINYKGGTITFNEQPTVLSGASLSAVGNSVIASILNLNNRGVIEFTGTYSTITVTSNTCLIGSAAITFGLAAPLPVTLTAFEGATKKEAVLLNWQTANELNNFGFEIEHSSDGKDFRKIGFEEGAGTTSATSAYQFTDSAPANGLNYYRLKQVDLDGDFEYSKVLTVAHKTMKTPEIQLYPNPVQDHLTISNAIGILTIYNHFGQRVHEIVSTSEQLNIDASNFASGHYVLHFRNANGDVIVKQFVK